MGAHASGPFREQASLFISCAIPRTPLEMEQGLSNDDYTELIKSNHERSNEIVSDKGL